MSSIISQISAALRVDICTRNVHYAQVPSMQSDLAGYIRLKPRWFKARRAPNRSRFDRSKSGIAGLQRSRAVRPGVLSTWRYRLPGFEASFVSFALLMRDRIIAPSFATYRSLCDSPIALGMRRYRALKRDVGTYSRTTIFARNERNHITVVKLISIHWKVIKCDICQRN